MTEDEELQKSNDELASIIIKEIQDIELREYHAFCKRIEEDRQYHSERGIKNWKTYFLGDIR